MQIGNFREFNPTKVSFQLTNDAKGSFSLQSSDHFCKSLNIPWWSPDTGSLAINSSIPCLRARSVSAVKTPIFREEQTEEKQILSAKKPLLYLLGLLSEPNFCPCSQVGWVCALALSLDKRPWPSYEHHFHLRWQIILNRPHEPYWKRICHPPNLNKITR